MQWFNIMLELFSSIHSFTCYHYFTYVKKANNPTLYLAIISLPANITVVVEELLA